MRKTLKTITTFLTPAILAGSLTAWASDFASTKLGQLCASDALECMISDAGVVIGAKGSTNGYKDNIDQAARTFKAHFGIHAPKAVVVLGNSLTPEQKQSLQKDYQVVLPWLTPKDKENMIKSAIERKVKAQMPDITDERLNQIVKRSLAASKAQNGLTNDAEEMAKGVLAHELGHMYFISTFWPDDHLDVAGHQSVDKLSRYGGPAADWLDEMAAVLLENESLTAKRYQGLQQLVQSGKMDELWHLKDYFTMVHPAFEQAKEIVRKRQKTAEGRAKGGVVVLSSSDHGKKSGPQPINFYYLSRAFADYMIETTGNKQIFAEITEYMAKGHSFKGWLALRQAHYGLPRSIDQLDKSLRSWMIARYSSNKG